MEKNGKVVTLGNKDCICLDEKPGYVYGSKPCPTCGGNGRNKKGTGKGHCPTCHGFRTVVDTDSFEVCGICNGTHSTPEDICSRIPDEWWPEFEFVVMRLDRRNTWNENYLGFGTIYSVTDYGGAYNSTDEQIIEKVRNKDNGYTQLISIAREENGVITICDKIGIYITRDGYHVKPIFIKE